jgi:ankyrin repeat protein
MSRQQDIFSVLRLNNFSSLKQFLSLNPNTPFTDVVDKNSATVLHLACNNDNKDIVELLLGEYDRRAKLQPEQYNTERKRYWINLKDGEGFACLHYAVFKANFAIARILEDNGADIYLVNSLGLCVMHIAAQGDSPLLIVIPKLSRTTT